jgi:hypothetical protein
MAQRRFGPVRGAGVSVTELEGDKTIEPGALGMCAYAGVLERGPVGELIFAPNKSSYLAQCGGRISDSLVPDVCFEYYDHAAGAGGLWLVRVTDGNELPAEHMVYARYGCQLTPMGKLEAKNGGRWGGKRYYHTGEHTGSGDITEITLDTGYTGWKNDQLNGGVLELAGVPNKQYPITGNTEAGVITVAADQTMLTDFGAAVDNRYYVTLVNEGKALSFLIEDGEENPTTEFALTVYVDGVLVKKYPNLSTDPTSSRYWVDLINNADDNYILKATDLWTGAHTAAVRPANIYGAVAALTALGLTTELFDFAVTNGDCVPKIKLGTTTDTMLAQKYTITFTSASAFDVVSDLFGALGSGTVDVEFDPGVKWCPPFVISDLGTAVEAGDVVSLNYKPFRADELVGGYVYPDKPNASRVRFRITENDHDSVVVADGSDMTLDGQAASASAEVTTGDADATVAFGDGSGFPALTCKTVAQTLTVTMADATDGAVVSSVYGALGTATVGSLFTPSANWREVPQFTISNGSTALEAGDVITITILAADHYMVVAPQEMAGGRDGIADLVDADYKQQAWDVNLSPFNQLFGKNVGLIKCATPNNTATAVQKAGVAYAAAKNYQYRYEIPANITTEIGADNQVNSTLGRNDFAVAAFPSFGWIADPAATEPGKLKQLPLTGQIHGREARIAVDYKGYHKAEAGVDAILASVLKITTGENILDEEYLNPLGIQIIKKVKGNFIIWGDRTLALDPTWKWKHQREMMSYYENVLRENFDWIIFAINDSVEQKRAHTALRSFFLPEWQPKRALRGDTFEQACLLKIDDENNTNLTMSSGDLNALIKLRLADTVERFNISIGKMGIFESVG